MCGDWGVPDRQGGVPIGRFTHLTHCAPDSNIFDCFVQVDRRGNTYLLRISFSTRFSPACPMCTWCSRMTEMINFSGTHTFPSQSILSWNNRTPTGHSPPGVWAVFHLSPHHSLREYSSHCKWGLGSPPIGNRTLGSPSVGNASTDQRGVVGGRWLTVPPVG